MHIDEFEFYEFSTFRVKKLPCKKVIHVICSLRKQVPKNVNVKRYSWVIPSKIKAKTVRC